MEPANSFPKRAWLTILIHPQETMRAILNSDSTKYVYQLAILYGVLGLAWSPKFTNNLVDDLFGMFNERTLAATVIVIVATVMVGALRGVVYLVVIAWLMTSVGRALGGKGQFTTVRTACAWSLVPAILGAIPFFWLSLVVTPENVGVLANIILAFSMIILFWGSVICVRGLQEAHQFSSGRSFGTLILAGIIVSLLSIVIMGQVVPLVRVFLT